NWKSPACRVTCLKALKSTSPIWKAVQSCTPATSSCPKASRSCNELTSWLPTLKCVAAQLPPPTRKKAARLLANKPTPSSRQVRVSAERGSLAYTVGTLATPARRMLGRGFPISETVHERSYTHTSDHRAGKSRAPVRSD